LELYILSFTVLSTKLL